MAANDNTRCLPNHEEQFGVRRLAQGNFDMWTEGTRDQTTDHVINGRPAPPPEPQELEDNMLSINM